MDVGELAQVPLQALGSQFGDSTAQWLYRLARGCDTEEVCTTVNVPELLAYGDMLYPDLGPQTLCGVCLSCCHVPTC